MKKSNLDEMQEQKLLRIEHIGCWLAFWGLAAAIVAQALLGVHPGAYFGELALMIVLSVYIVAACLRHGIWDRRLKPDRKTNLLASLAAGAFIIVFCWLAFSRLDMEVPTLLAVSLSLGAGTGLLCFGALTLCARLYRNKRKELDQE